MVLGLILIALIGLGLTNCIRKRRPPRDGGQRPPTEEATIVCREYDETELFNFLHPVDTRNLSTEVPVFEERRGNSEPLDYSPLEGFHITAERDAFKENTVVMMTPKTTATEAELRAYESIENEGYMLVDCYDVDAGLDDNEVMPGEYTVTVDLSVLDIDPSLYPYLSVFRVGDDGSYYEYSTEITDGQLVYRSDQNCSVGFVVALVGVFTYFYGPAVYNEFQGPNTYFHKMKYDLKKDVMHDEWTHNGVSFKLSWAPKELGADKLYERIKEITWKYESIQEELYRKYQEDLDFEKTNILQSCSRGKDVAQIVKKAIDNDPEYQQLQKEIRFPEIVEYAVQCINEAITYLKEYEHVKMPTGVVQIVSRQNDKDMKVLAQVVNRVVHEAYVEINLQKLKKGNQKVKDEFLITITHELLHVCQQNYRAYWADANRYDELVAVYMEWDLLEHFRANGLITSPDVSLSPTQYWSTLKLPIDKYDTREDGTVMRHEGYNLGLFVKYLQEKLHIILYAGKMMRAKSYIWEGGASKPLMEVFGISEQEFDIYYRGFILSNKKKMSDHYHSYPSEEEKYDPYKEITIAKGKKYHERVKTEGSYSSAIHGFKQKNKDPMNLVLVPDDEFAHDHPGCMLVPVDDYAKIPKGFYIPAVNTGENYPLRDILEIHGAIGYYNDKEVIKTVVLTGFTLYVWDKTRRPQAKEDDEHLIIKMPKNSIMADDGIVDGYELTIEAENGKELHKVIMPTFFEKEVKIDKRELYGRTGRKKDLRVKITLCEFIRMKDNSRLRGEESYVREFTLSGYNRAENTGYGEPDEPEEPDEPVDIDEGDDSNVKYCWQLVDTKVESKPHESSEIGSSCSYSASAGSHLKKGVYIGNDYEGHRYAFSATIQAPPARIEGGQTLILHATLQNTEGTEGYIFEEASLSFEDESIPMGFTNGSIGKVTKLKGSTKVIIGGDSSGSWDYEIRIPAGSEGSRKALNFFSCGSRTHWVYEWKEVSD